MIPPPSKPLVWAGSTRADIRLVADVPRRSIGRELRRIQRGELPRDWKPMQTVGPGAAEIRVHTDVEHRAIYVARFEEAVYVLHIFEKRTQKTPKRDIEIARRRYQEVLARRA